MNWLKEIGFFILGVITFVQMMFFDKSDPHTHFEGRKK